MANINEVIDLMVANKEPDEKIREVINKYNESVETTPETSEVTTPEVSGDQTPTDTTEKVENMVSTGEESSTDTPVIKPDQVIEQGGYEYKFGVSDDDKPIYYTKKKDDSNWSVVNPDLDENNFITNPAYVSIGQEFNHFKGEDFDREAYFKAKNYKKEPDSRGWFEQAMDAGAINADLYDNADAIFDINNTDEARNLSNPELQAYIDLVVKSKTAGSEMKELNKFTTAFEKYNKKGENWLTSTIMAVKENGGVTGGGMKGFAQASIQSYRSMINKELLKEAAAPTLGAAGAGSVIPGVGTLTAATTALFTSLNYGLETINTFNTLLEEEIANNPEKYKNGFTPESIRMVMANDEARTRIKKQARARGRTIATVEGVTNVIGIKGSGAVLKAGEKVASTVGKAGIKTAAGTVAAGTEIIGGGFGEYAGEKVIGRDASGVEIVLEGLSMAAVKAPVDVTVASIELAKNRPSYQIDGVKASKQAVEDYVNGAETAEEIANLNVKINNDDAFSKAINDKIVNTQLETQVNERIEDPSDRQKMVDLERQRKQAELDAKKKGIQAVPGAKETLESIEMQMNEIVGKYTAIDGRTSDVRARKKTAQDVRTRLDEISAEATRAAAAKTTATIKKQMEAVDKKTGRKGQVIEMTSEDIAESESETTALFEAEIEGYKQKLNNIKDKKSTEYIDAKDNLDFIQQQLNGIKTADTQFGYIVDRTDGSYDIILNKDKPMVGTAAHEFQHRILSRTLKNNQDIQDKAGKALTDYVVGKFGGVSPAFINRMSAYIDPETGEQVSEFGEEIITVMSESILDGSLKYNENLFTKVGDVIRQTLQRVGAIDIKFNTGRDIYNFIKDYNRSIQKDYVSRSIVKMAAEGAKGKLVEGEVKTEPTTYMSRSGFNEAEVIEDLGLKEATADIVARNTKIENTILEEGIKDEEGNIKASPAQQRKLAENNLPRAFALAKQAAGRAKDLTLDDALKIDDVMEFYSEYSLKLTELARTYKAQMTDTKTGKVVKVPFGAYMNSLLPLKYSGILDKLKSKVETTSLSDEATARKARNIEDTTDETKTKGTKTKLKQRTSRKLTSLADLDIESSLLVKRATKVQLQKLIESNPKNLVEEVQKVLIPDLVEIVRQEMGVVGQVKGELNIPDSYNAYLSDTYQMTISSMEISKVRANYKDLFTKEKMGFADYSTKKSDKPSLKKDSNYVKDINRNVTTKAEFIKYHTEGKKNKLINNQRNLAIMRAEAEAVRAAENYIIDNSENLNQVYGAELRNFIDAKTIEKQNLEDKSFDSVKYSKSLAQKSLQQVGNLVNLTENNAITDTWNLETQQPIKGKYTPEIIQIVWNQVLKGNIYSDKSKALVDIIRKIPKNLIKENLGTALEQYKINVGVQAAKKHEGFTMLGEWVQEGGIPDFFADIHGAALYAEAKFATSRGGKTTTNETNWKTGKFKINKRLEGNIDLVEKSVKKALKKSDQLVKDLKELGFNIVDQDTVVDLNTHKNLGPKKAIVSDASVIADESFIGKIYANKDFPVYLIDIDGAGLYYMPGDPFIEALAKELGIPKLEGKFPLITRILPQKVSKKGVKIGYKYKLTTEPLIDPSNLKVKSDFSLSDIKTFDAIMNSKTVANLKLQQEAKSKQKFSKSINYSRTINDTKGITVLDFDDTLAITKSLVKYTTSEGETGTLNAEQYANSYESLLDKGYTFDFSDFNKVVKGKLAPLFQKALKLQGKFGPENMFVLTARPPASAKAIFDFLKGNGLNIPLKNITGLGNSTAEAKALWIAGKVGEGYNDFYFADDALQNVQAVDNMLEQFDVKRKVQQAKIKFSKDMNTDFNNILEEVTGIESIKRFAATKARKRGADKGKFRFFIPPSHEDFVGLLYNFMGKGRQGDGHRNFFEQALIRPLNRANREYDTARQSIANDYKALNKQFPDIRKKLTKKTPDGDFTFQDAIRVYLWNKHDHNIPGLSEIDQANLSELVMSDPSLQTYAETLNTISKQETYINPTDGWESGDIRVDLDDATGRVGRDQYFDEFNENADIVFSEENLNKIEAGFGNGVREAFEDMLYRIKTGRNRPTGQNRIVNGFMNYLNGSVGTVMFFNMRSALLQQMSLVNYINFADNNIFAAAKAFANQKQYWKDFAFIFNSDMLKQRRGGIQTDVNGAELAESLRNSKNPTRKLISKLLELGFLPTQIGDNIAIATGGSPYYRNRINTYLKQGLNEKEAEAKAFTDFQNLTQSTQQSARPDMVSQQQASVIGKVILNFQNVTSQFNRLGKKAFQDIYNRRITQPNTTQMQSDISNAARITYYFAVQNAIFYTLQTALFAMLFDDDEEDDNKLFLKKKERLINGSIDSVLRGSGVLGAVIATLKNVAIAFARQRDVRYNPDESAVLMEALNLSPVLGIKGRKITNAEKTLNYNKNIIEEMSTFDIDNPQWSAATNYVEMATNVPLNRLYNKTQNVRQALNNDHSNWERTLMFLGWSQYNLNLENKKMDEVKETVKVKKKEASKVKREEKKQEKLKQKEAEGIEKQKKEKKEGKKVTCLVCKLPVVKGKKYCTVHEKKEQTEGGKKKQCKKIKGNGKRCGMQTSNKSGLCYYHD